MIEVTRTLFPQMDERETGRVIAYLYGDLRNFTPVWIVAGSIDVLAEDLLATDTAILKLSDEDLFGRFGDSGTIQIDQERIDYDGKNAAQLALTGLTRGAHSTEAKEHKAGAQVYEVLPTVKAVIGENPTGAARAADDTGLTLRVKDVPAVRLNGRLKLASEPPTHTINLADVDTVPSRELVTIEFDLDSIPGTKVDTPAPSPTPPPVAVTPNGAYTPPPIPETGYGSSGGDPGDPAGGFAPTGGGSTGIGGGGLTPPAVTQPVFQFPPPLVGQLEVDVLGLQDDDIGTITGSANQFLDRPSWIVRAQLREAWGELDDALFNLDTFTATLAKQIETDLVWAMAYEGESFTAWRGQVLLEGLAHLYQHAGRWCYTYRTPARVPAYTFTEREIVGERLPVQQPIFTFTPRTDLTTELIVTYGRPKHPKRFTLRDPNGLARYGTQRNRQLNLKWTVAETPARTVALAWLKQWARQRLQVTIPTIWDAIVLEPWDAFAVDVPLLSSFGGPGFLFHVIDSAFDPDHSGFTISGLEGDAVGIVLKTGVRARAAHQIRLGTGIRVGVRSAVAAGVGIELYRFAGSYPGSGVMEG